MHNKQVHLILLLNPLPIRKIRCSLKYPNPYKNVILSHFGVLRSSYFKYNAFNVKDNEKVIPREILLNNP